MKVVESKDQRITRTRRELAEFARKPLTPAAASGNPEAVAYRSRMIEMLRREVEAAEAEVQS